MKNTDKDYFERFSFGDSPEMADELLALVLAGKKTATVSVILEDEQAPSVGDLSLVLDGLSTPACVIKTVHVETVKFCDLTWDMVKLEGEDENFEQWKSGNIRYWTRDAAKRGYTFTDQTPITFERFENISNSIREYQNISEHIRTYPRTPAKNSVKKSPQFLFDVNSQKLYN